MPKGIYVRIKYPDGKSFSLEARKRMGFAHKGNLGGMLGKHH